MNEPDNILRHEFVEFVPEKVEQGVLYISIPYATAIHRCCCGCGHEVVTPFSPNDWRIIFDGLTVSLDPSIGNWSFDCQSHYFIRRNRVEWWDKWSKEQIDRGRALDTIRKDRYYERSDTHTAPVEATQAQKPSNGIVASFRRLWPF